MPFLSLVHLKTCVCARCGAVLGAPGARSFVVDAGGTPINFSENDAPAEMLVEIACPNGHVTELAVPLEISAEESLLTPDDAPIGRDAILVGEATDSGAAFP